MQALKDRVYSTVNDMIVIKSVKENVGLGSRAGGKEYFK